MRLLSSMVAALALASPALALGAPTHWIVAPDGSGDFLDVASAVAAVAPGDVLLIAPGSYGSVVVAKALTLLGDPDQPRPTFTVLRFEGIERFDALHLDADALEVRNVPGLSHVDDCKTRGADLSGQLNLRISRSAFQPAPHALGKTAVFVLGVPGSPSSSRLRFVDCVLAGGRGLGYVDLGSFVAGHGGTGLFAGFAEVRTAGTTIAGGDGTSDSWATGSGGTGLVASACGVEIRGSAHDEIRGGKPDPLLPGLVASPPIEASATSNVIHSGVTVVGAALGPVLQVADRPYLEITGTDGPGAVRWIDLYAAGDLALIAIAGAPAFDLTVAATLGAPLEIDPASVVLTFSAVPAGQDAPASAPFTLPASPALAGMKVYAQALVLAGAGASLTNAAAVVLAF